MSGIFSIVELDGVLVTSSGELRVKEIITPPAGTTPVLFSVYNKVNGKKSSYDSYTVPPGQTLHITSLEGGGEGGGSDRHQIQLFLDPLGNNPAGKNPGAGWIEQTLPIWIGTGNFRKSFSDDDMVFLGDGVLRIWTGRTRMDNGKRTIGVEWSGYLV